MPIPESYIYSSAQLKSSHNFVSESKFYIKTWLLIFRRKFQNLLIADKKFSFKQALNQAPVISFSESELWNPGDNDENWILTAGKIENLRIASKKLNGLRLPAKHVFSFWKHIGKPSQLQGYVLGREIREGCIVPTIAGGLCQLSNALYDAALKAGFEIIERHRHTKVIEGSLAEKDRDATVKWNFVDLRFRSKYPFYIDIEFTPDKFIVKFRGEQSPDHNNNDKHNTDFKPSKLNDCFSCGNYDCFRHPGTSNIKKQKSITTFILDDKWPEYDEYLRNLSQDKVFILPIRKNKFLNSNRYAWSIKNEDHIKSAPIVSLERALQVRFLSKSKNNVFSLMLSLDKKLAKAMAKQIPIESTHLVISQNFLPFIYESGVLGGRTYDVLMTRLPFEKLHDRLDLAYKMHPESKTLNDFRASDALIDLENIALTKSKHVITPHQEIANIFQNKVIKLDWHIPNIAKKPAGTKILFPASAVGRKGAYEMKRLAKELNLSLVILGKAVEDARFWDGVATESASLNPFDNIGLVIFPTYIEHQPRIVLKAIAAGIPVVTTTACGLQEMENVSIVPIGDYEALKEKVLEAILKMKSKSL